LDRATPSLDDTLLELDGVTKVRATLEMMTT